MPLPPPVLAALARRHERSAAGRTGAATRDLLVDVEVLLREAGAPEGDARARAEHDLRAAEQAGLLRLEPLHPRDPRSLHQVRFNPARETDLFAAVGRPAPAQIRAALARQFQDAAHAGIPDRWREPWEAWCRRLAAAAQAGGSVEPFDRSPSPDNARLLALLPRLLAWEGESLVRFASCVLCGDSKTLETLAARDREGELRDQLRGKLGRLLEEITGGQLRTLDQLGILPNPRFALVHGPLQLELPRGRLDLGLLRGAFRIAEADLAAAQGVNTTARRCLTVENETSFHELAQLQSGELLVQTSYPGSGTLALLRRLPAHLEFRHFGDSDEAGFDILRVLREATGRDFQPLHMQRGRLPAEQEALGRPTRPDWPFYD
ncbi:MAG: hypothetical protein RJA22_2985 [Verrucomicrobiota bacterium]